MIVQSDGLDPIFGQINEILVIGGDSVIFGVSVCKVLYFDDHYHAYVISVEQLSLFQLYWIIMYIMHTSCQMDFPTFP